MKRAGAKAILKGYPLWQERGLMAESCRRMRTTCRTPAARGFGAVPSSGASLFRERVDLGKLSRIVSFFGAPPSETGGGPPCGSPAAIRGLLGILSDQDTASLPFGYEEIEAWMPDVGAVVEGLSRVCTPCVLDEGGRSAAGGEGRGDGWRWVKVNPSPLGAAPPAAGAAAAGGRGSLDGLDPCRRSEDTREGSRGDTNVGDGVGEKVSSSKGPFRMRQQPGGAVTGGGGGGGGGGVRAGTSRSLIRMAPREGGTGEEGPLYGDEGLGGGAGSPGALHRFERGYPQMEALLLASLQPKATGTSGTNATTAATRSGTSVPDPVVKAVQDTLRSAWPGLGLAIGGALRESPVKTESTDMELYTLHDWQNATGAAKRRHQALLHCSGLIDTCLLSALAAKTGRNSVSRKESRRAGEVIQQAGSIHWEVTTREALCKVRTAEEERDRLRELLDTAWCQLRGSLEAESFLVSQRLLPRERAEARGLVHRMRQRGAQGFLHLYTEAFRHEEVGQCVLALLESPSPEVPVDLTRQTWDQIRDDMLSMQESAVAHAGGKWNGGTDRPAACTALARKEFLEHLRLAGSSPADEWSRVRDLVVVESLMEVPVPPCRRCGQHREEGLACDCPTGLQIAWGLHDAANTAWVALLRGLGEASSSHNSSLEALLSECDFAAAAAWPALRASLCMCLADPEDETADPHAVSYALEVEEALDLGWGDLRRRVVSSTALRVTAREPAALEMSLAEELHDEAGVMWQTLKETALLAALVTAKGVVRRPKAYQEAWRQAREMLQTEWRKLRGSIDAAARMGQSPRALAELKLAEKETRQAKGLRRSAFEYKVNVWYSANRR